MFLPDIYKIEDKHKIEAFIRAYGFADLVTTNNAQLCCNKVPLLFDNKGHCLYGHFGKNSPQLDDLESTNEVLLVFTGPHSYVTPQWHKSQDMVPAWNFQTLKICGKARQVNEENC